MLRVWDITTEFILKKQEKKEIKLWHAVLGECIYIEMRNEMRWKKNIFDDLAFTFKMFVCRKKCMNMICIILEWDLNADRFSELISGSGSEMIEIFLWVLSNLLVVIKNVFCEFITVIYDMNVVQLLRILVNLFDLTTALVKKLIDLFQDYPFNDWKSSKLC